jgi:putative transposase
MPAKNSIKTYVENGYYHIYNRGIEKRPIFLDSQDYGVFLSYLKEYLSPKTETELRNKLNGSELSSVERDKIWSKLRMKNFNADIVLLAYSLMPNHFHLFIKQNTMNGIDKLMKSLGTRFVMYFNRKYSREGSLFQGRYKAVLITDEAYFIHISRYIHKQAISMKGQTLHEIQPSSLSDYLGIKNTTWVHPEEILTLFSNQNPKMNYESFIKENIDSDDLEHLYLEE